MNQHATITRRKNQYTGPPIHLKFRILSTPWQDNYLLIEVDGMNEL